jgi:molybdopterin-guanine dinucleotide biosynthesis protein A
MLGGRTILERQLTELQQVAGDLLIVGAVPSCAGPGGQPVRTVPDRVSGRGPLAGLDTALAEARDELVIVLACDMPFVTAALLDHLLTLAPGSDAVVPRTERGYHPLCAVYARTCRPVVARCLAEGRLALREVLKEVRVRAIGGDELERFGDRHRLLANINTPAEYEELEALQAHDR